MPGPIHPGHRSAWRDVKQGRGIGRTCREGGFTLIELTIVLVIVSFVFGAITIVIITSLKDDSGVSTRLSDSHDAQITAAYFTRDVESSNVVTTMTPATPLCGTGTQVLGVAWQPTEGTTTYVSYVTELLGSSPALVRNFCSGGSTTTSTVAHDLSGLNSVGLTPACSPNYAACNTATGLTPANEVASLQISVTEQSGYQYTLTASPRLFMSSGGRVFPPGSSPPTLLLLGAGANVVSCSGTGRTPLDVNGLAAVDSISASSIALGGGQSLTAEQVYSENSATSGSTAPVQPPSAYTSTTSQPYSSGGPIPDPYQSLPDPSTSGLTVYTTSSALPGPGVYTNPVSITNSQTISGGTYIFEGGFSVQGGGGGTVTVSSSGASVLFFIGIPGASPSTPEPASYSVTGNGAVNLTGMTTGTYAGLVLFQSRYDSNTVYVAGNGSSSFYSGAIYAPDATVNTSGNGGTYSSSIVAQSLICGGNGGTNIGPSVVPTTTVVTSSQPSSLSGQSVTFTATVTGGNGLTPGGTVTFTETPQGSSTAVTMCSNVSLSNGSATCASPPLTAGGSPYTIAATYSGNLTFQSSTGSFSQNVTIASTGTVVSASPSSAVSGQAVTFTATVSPAPDAGTISWAIAFGASGSLSCSSTTALSGGVATCTISTGVLMAANSQYTVTASYGGDASYAASSGSLTFSVSKAATTTAPPTSNTQKAGMTATFSTSVMVNAPGSGMPTGTVTFTASKAGSTTVTLCTAVVSSGAASCQAMTPATKGNWTLTATYSGDSNYVNSVGNSPWKLN